MEIIEHGSWVRVSDKVDTKMDHQMQSTGLAPRRQGDGTGRAHEEGVCILAGYARVERSENGTVAVEAQLFAFRAAMLFAKDIQERTGNRPPISVGIDHKGTFRKQFLASDLSSKQKRNPTLIDLHPDVVNVYRDVAKQIGVTLEDIIILPEDSARARITNALLKLDIPRSQLQGLIVSRQSQEIDFSPACSLTENEASIKSDTLTATCAALVVEDFRCSAREDLVFSDSTRLEVFYEESAWSPSSLFVKAIQYSHKLGLRFAVRLHLVSSANKVTSGKLCTASGPFAQK